MSLAKGIDVITGITGSPHFPWVLCVVLGAILAVVLCPRSECTFVRPQTSYNPLAEDRNPGNRVQLECTEDWFYFAGRGHGQLPARPSITLSVPLCASIEELQFELWERLGFQVDRYPTFYLRHNYDIDGAREAIQPHYQLSSLSTRVLWYVTEPLHTVPETRLRMLLRACRMRRTEPPFYDFLDETVASLNQAVLVALIAVESRCSMVHIYLGLCTLSQYSIARARFADAVYRGCMMRFTIFFDRNSSDSLLELFLDTRYRAYTELCDVGHEVTADQVQAVLAFGGSLHVWPANSQLSCYAHVLGRGTPEAVALARAAAGE